MIDIFLIVQIYLAILIVTILHEWGHMGKPRIVRWIPIPEGASINVPPGGRYTGLLVNLFIIYMIFILQPRMFFLQLIGLTAWVHFIWYVIWGSFNYEPEIPDSLRRFFITDDIPNELWWIAVPLGIFIFYYFRVYYLNILMQIVGMLV